MGQRASRVLQQESTRSQRSTTSSGAKTTRKLTTAVVEHYWRRMYLLIRTFLGYIQVKNLLICLMPMETVCPTEDEDEFEKIDVDEDHPKKENKRKPWRILEFHGEKYVVGKELKEAKGAKDVKKHTHDPMTCQHPSDKMSGRGGRADHKWWSCQACGTRWERIPLSKFETTSQPSCKDLLTFGKHAGKTYDFVYLNHINYCEWILKAESGDDACAQLVKFARYLATREARSPGDVPAGRMDEEL